MRSQIFMLPMMQDPSDEDNELVIASGFLLGILINCETDELLKEKLEAVLELGHYADVQMLSDDEPWPSIEERRKKILEGI